MRAIRFWIPALAVACSLPAQVLAPEEIQDPQIKALQRQYFDQLKTITKAAAEHKFPYHFYFSRKLDLSEKEQGLNDQRAVQFDRYDGKLVLKITGNYFASYSADLMTPEERARQTYQDVMLPLLIASAQALQQADVPDAFAFEISHHIRKKVLGVTSEGVENVVLILPKAAALSAAAASDPAIRQTAVLQGQAFLNAVPISFWPRPETAAVAETASAKQPSKAAPAPVVVVPPAPSASPQPNPTVSARLLREAGITPAPVNPPPGLLAKQPAMPAAENPAAARDTSPDALKKVQSTHQPDLDRMVRDVNPQAHFVAYAPPAFVPFHQGLYLQLSVTTTLARGPIGSQYAIAALAFDQHIAHLIRPVMGYFKGTPDDFDGIDFSTSVRLAGDTSPEGSAVAVEFIFPQKLLEAYALFDCTGQQLIDGSYVLINGERVSLNLQIAESGLTPK
jgi:hypothetical protein